MKGVWVYIIEGGVFLMKGVWVYIYIYYSGRYIGRDIFKKGLCGIYSGWCIGWAIFVKVVWGWARGVGILVEGSGCVVLS